MDKFSSFTSIEPIISFLCVFFYRNVFWQDSSPFEESQLSMCLAFSSGTAILGCTLELWLSQYCLYSREELVELKRTSISTFTVFRSEVTCPNIEKESHSNIKTCRTKVWRVPVFEFNLCHSTLTWQPDPGYVSSANPNFHFHRMGIKMPAVT